MDLLKTRADILDIIDNVSRDEGLNNYDIVGVQGNQKGEGFFGEVFFVTVRDNITNKDLSVILKCAPQDEKIRESVPVRIVYENEVRFYTEIYPAFLEFEKSCGVAETVNLVPKCYAASLQSGAELVVLENLKPLGFETFPKSSLWDHDHVKMIFERYGRYHAFSYAFKHQHPEEFRRLTGILNDAFGNVSYNEGFMRIFVESARQVKALFSPAEDEDLLKRLKKYETMEGVSKIFRDCASGGSSYPVIAHGDSWSNNMMFKYERIGDEKKLKDMRIIDWQVVSATSPACDLAYCLYSGGTKEMFDRLDDYLKIYHEKLSSCLRQLGTDPEKVFPFSALKKEWHQFAKFGFTIALMIARIKVTHEGHVEDLTDFAGRKEGDVADIYLNAKCDEELYKKRMVDLVRHVADIDAL